MKKIWPMSKLIATQAVFNFGILYLVLNISSLFVELSDKPFGGFLGQSIFVLVLTVFNVLLLPAMYAKK